MEFISVLAAWIRLWCSKHQKMLKSLYYDITEALILVAAAGVLTALLYVWMLCW